VESSRDELGGLIVFTVVRTLIGVRATLISNKRGQRVRGADNKWDLTPINFPN
jgi:hypothetical protein